MGIFAAIQLALGFGTAIMGAKQKVADAATEKERIRADFELGALENQRKTQIKAVTAAVTASLMFPFIVYINKIILVDKLGWFCKLNNCTTDPLPQNLWAIFFTLLAYFTVTKAVPRIWKRR